MGDGPQRDRSCRKKKKKKKWFNRNLTGLVVCGRQRSMKAHPAVRLLLTLRQPAAAPSSRPLSRLALRAAIAPSDAAAPPRLDCPCCGVAIRASAARQHLALCAPDARDHVLARLGRWPASAESAFAVASERENASLAALKQLRFAQGVSWAAAATALATPEVRLRRMLRRDSLSISLVLDAEPCHVLFEDAELLVLAKPAGLRTCPVHRFEGGSLLNRAAGHVGATHPVPCVVHRLDQDTSGVCLFAKSRATAASLAQQFRAKTVQKEYAAICLGTPPAHRFWVDAPVGLHPSHQPARTVGGAFAKPARTLVSVELYRPPCGARPAACLVRARPESGRTHQIRLHLAASGLPIAMDTFYGPTETALSLAAAGASLAGCERQALHAAALTVRSPTSGCDVTFSAPLPEDMRSLGAALGLLCDADADADADGAGAAEGALAGREALAAVLGDGAAAGDEPSVGGVLCLDWTKGNTVPLVYRDEPGEAWRAAAELCRGAVEGGAEQDDCEEG